MITCNLGGKAYTVDFITGRALREMGPAWDAYTRIARATSDAIEGKETPDAADEKAASNADGYEKELDTLIKWFCILFRNQFTPDDMYDGYPVDRLVHDIVLALLSVRAQTTEVLDTFPTTAARNEAQKTEV